MWSKRSKRARGFETTGAAEASEANESSGAPNGKKRQARGERPKPTALVAATDILARQEYSTRRLVEKLLRKGYGREEIVAAIKRLQELRYLDDASACARQFAYLYEESRSSVRQIVAKLIKRGFPASLVTSCVPKSTGEREERAAYRTLLVKYRRGADEKKMLASLFRSGFDASVAREAVRRFQEEMEQEEL